MTYARRPRIARRASQGEHGTVLVAERDQETGDRIRAFLTGEGYGVTVVFDTRLEAIAPITEVWRPDFLLLGGQDARNYAGSWDVAARMRAGDRPMQVVMLTTDLTAAAEARAGTSLRSRDFAGVVTGPFDLRELLLALRRRQAPGRRQRPAPRERQRR